jgi:hypothetical protein
MVVDIKKWMSFIPHKPIEDIHRYLSYIFFLLLESISTTR